MEKIFRLDLWGYLVNFHVLKACEGSRKRSAVTGRVYDRASAQEGTEQVGKTLRLHILGVKKAVDRSSRRPGGRGFVCQNSQRHGRGWMQNPGPPAWSLWWAHGNRQQYLAQNANDSVGPGTKEHIKCRMPSHPRGQALSEWKKENKQTNKQRPKNTGQAELNTQLRENQHQPVSQDPSGDQNCALSWHHRKRDRAVLLKGGSPRRRLCFKPQMHLIGKKKHVCHQLNMEVWSQERYGKLGFGPV